jgi:hypothetical protein
MSLTIDSSMMKRAIRFVVYEVGAKDLPDTLNSASLDTGIKAIKNTPRASTAKIAAVTDAQLAGRIANRFRKRGKKIPKGKMADLIKAERKRMRASRAFTAGPGWDKAVRAFGGRGVKRQKGFEQSEASKGKGSKASKMKLIAELVNTTPAGEKIGKEALQQSLDQAALGLATYGHRRLQRTFDKVNA